MSGIVWPDGPQVDRQFTEINGPRLEDSNDAQTQSDAQLIVCSKRNRAFCPDLATVSGQDRLSLSPAMSSQGKAAWSFAIMGR